MHFNKCIMKRLKIPVIWQLNDVTIMSYNDLIEVWTSTKNYHAFIGSIKSLNCVSIVNILSRQNILKTTSKILFDDVIVTTLDLSVIHYNQKIEHAPMINCSKFHHRIKAKNVMEGGGESTLPPPTFDWATSKKLSLDRVRRVLSTFILLIYQFKNTFFLSLEPFYTRTWGLKWAKFMNMLRTYRLGTLTLDPAQDHGNNFSLG